MLPVGGPGAPILFGNVHPDNSLITVSQIPLLPGYNLDGIETITYFYGSSFLLPAPPSLVLLSAGLIVIGGLAWRRRKAKVVA
jgi:hypothetical protein